MTRKFDDFKMTFLYEYSKLFIGLKPAYGSILKVLPKQFEAALKPHCLRKI